MSINKHSFEADIRSAKDFHGPKPAKFLPCLLVAALLSGCARHYDILMTDGTRVTNVTKPIKNKETGMLVYKDVAGHEHMKSAAHVVVIEPHTSKNNPPGF